MKRGFGFRAGTLFLFLSYFYLFLNFRRTGGGDGCEFRGGGIEME